MEINYTFNPILIFLFLVIKELETHHKLDNDRKFHYQ
jgi:hypothetical protein